MIKKLSQKREKVVVVSADTHAQLVRMARNNDRTLKSQLAQIVGEYYANIEIS